MFEFFIKILLTFIPKVRINSIPALIQIMAWRQSGDKPLSEQKMVYWRMYELSVPLLTISVKYEPKYHNFHGRIFVEKRYGQNGVHLASASQF